MKYWVVDSETTGLTNEDRAVEVAGFYCDDGLILGHYQSLVNPQRSIPPEASAIHHITDRMVEDAPKIDAAMQPFFEVEFDFVVAHNAKFDMRFMDFGTAPWLCTWKLANKVYKEAPSYANQVLRYYLGLSDPVVASTSFAHRALYDSEVTTNLFHDIVSKATSEDPYPAMIEFCTKPLLLKKVGFGAHKGKLWSEVPRNYLDYILNKSSGWEEDVLHTARTYFQR